MRQSQLRYFSVIAHATLTILVLASVRESHGQFITPAPLDFAVMESGPDDDISVQLRIEAEDLEGPFLTGPSGEQLELTPSALFDLNGEASWEGTFDSLREAFAFLEGDWAGTYYERRIGVGEPVVERRIQIPAVSDNDLVRAAPVLLEPLANAMLPDGQEALFSWEYLDDAADQTLVQFTVPLDAPIGSTTVFSTPLGGSRQGSSFNTVLRRTWRNEPGASTDRWLFSFESLQDTWPLDVGVRLGGRTDLSGMLLFDGMPAPRFQPQFNRFTYVKMSDVITTFSIVPEPSSLALTLFCLSLGTVRSRSGVRQ